MDLNGQPRAGQALIAVVAVALIVSLIVAVTGTSVRFRLPAESTG